MTSNIGSEYLLNNNREMVDTLLHNTFKPEFLNRIDEIIYFSPLSKETQRKVVDKMLNLLSDRLKESYYIFTFSNALKDYILENAYSEKFGARPIKRFIQRNVETLLAELIIEGKVKTETKYLVDYDGSNIIVK